MYIMYKMYMCVLGYVYLYEDISHVSTELGRNKIIMKNMNYY